MNDQDPWEERAVTSAFVFVACMLAAALIVAWAALTGGV